MSEREVWSVSLEDGAGKRGLECEFGSRVPESEVWSVSLEEGCRKARLEVRTN